MKRVVTAPRIAGVLLIAIGFLNAITSFWGALLAIVGLIIILLPTEYAKTQFDQFTSSFSSWKKILLTGLVFDFALLLLIASAGFLYQSTLTSTVNELQSGMTYSKEVFASPELTNTAAQGVQKLVFTFAIGFAAFIVIGLLAYTIFRLLSWFTIANQKLSKQAFFKFLGLNSIWWLIWLIVLGIVGFSVGRDPSGRFTLLIILFIAGYFTMLVHALFAKTQRIGYSLSNGVSFGIGKIHRLLIPASFVLIAFYIIRFGMFYVLGFIPSIIGEVIKALLLILFFAWLRIYLYPIIADLPKHEV